MPYWRNMPSIPKVRNSSGTIGTMCLPRALSFISAPSTRTNAIVVEISRPSLVAAVMEENRSIAGTGRDGARSLRDGTKPSSARRRASRYSCSGEPSANFKYSTFSTCSSVSGRWKRSRKASSCCKSIFLDWCATFCDSAEPPIAQPLTVCIRISVGLPLSCAALYAA